MQKRNYALKVKHVLHRRNGNNSIVLTFFIYHDMQGCRYGETGAAWQPHARGIVRMTRTMVAVVLGEKMERTTSDAFL